MTITLTINEARDLGLFQELCDAKGWDPYRVSAIGDPDDGVTLTIEQAREMGLINRLYNQ